MNFKKMSLREQVLTFSTIAVFVLGGYGLFRFYPLNKEIGALQQETRTMDRAVKTGKIPNMPNENVQDLKSRLAEVDQKIGEAEMLLQEVNARLGGEDTTNIRLEISNVARNAFVRINVNEEIKLPVVTDAGKIQATPAQKNVTKSDLRRRARNARIRAARSGNNVAPVQTTTTVAPTQVTALVRKMAPGTPTERPLQRLTMEGTFAGIMRFLEGLDQMSLMATVVEMQISVAPQSPPPGYNQRLNAVMLLAL